MVKALVESIDYGHCSFHLCSRRLKLADREQLILVDGVFEYAEQLIWVEVTFERFYNFLVLLKHEFELFSYFFLDNHAEFLILRFDETLGLIQLHIHLLIHYFELVLQLFPLLTMEIVFLYSVL